MTTTRQAVRALFATVSTTAAACAAALLLTACGGNGSDDSTDTLLCPATVPAGQVIYGSGRAPSDFIGPLPALQPAPASVSAAAGRPMFICP